MLSAFQFMRHLCDTETNSLENSTIFLFKFKNVSFANNLSISIHSNVLLKLLREKRRKRVTTEQEESFTINCTTHNIVVRL